LRAHTRAPDRLLVESLPPFSGRTPFYGLVLMVPLIFHPFTRRITPGQPLLTSPFFSRACPLPFVILSPPVLRLFRHLLLACCCTLPPFFAHFSAFALSPLACPPLLWSTPPLGSLARPLPTPCNPRALCFHSPSAPLGLLPPPFLASPTPLPSVSTPPLLLCPHYHGQSPPEPVFAPPDCSSSPRPPNPLALPLSSLPPSPLAVFDFRPTPTPLATRYLWRPPCLPLFILRSSLRLRSCPLYPVAGPVPPFPCSFLGPPPSSQWFPSRQSIPTTP